jgi:hypothetical protein
MDYLWKFASDVYVEGWTILYINYVWFSFMYLGEQYTFLWNDVQLIVWKSLLLLDATSAEPGEAGSKLLLGCICYFTNFVSYYICVQFLCECWEVLTSL